MKKTKVLVLSLGAIIGAIFFIGMAPAQAAGTLTNFSYSSTSYNAGATATYTFNYTTETPLVASDEIIQVQFPDGVSDRFSVPADFATSDVSVTVDGVPKTVSSILPHSIIVAIASINEEVPTGSDVSVQIRRIKNPDSAGSYSFDHIGTFDNGNNVIDAVASINPVDIVIYNDVWVDDDYTAEGSNDGHTWGADAFDNINDAINAVTENGTVHVLAGEYVSASTITITKTIALAGPGVAGIDEEDQATVTNTTCVSDQESVVLSIEASSIEVSGLNFSEENGDEYCYGAPGYGAPVIRVINGDGTTANVTIDDNTVAGGLHGIAVQYGTESTTISNNVIHDDGVNGISLASSLNNQIFGNEIYGNDSGIYMFHGGEGDGQFGGTNIYNNEIYNNQYGIYFDAEDQSDLVTIGPNNNIRDNGDGIYIDGNAANLHINGNQIFDNTNETSALHVENATTGLDATGNWWGDESGPNVIDYNEDTAGDVITIIDSDFVYFRPFCTDTDCNDLSSVQVSPETISDLFDNGGSIVPNLVMGGGSNADILVTSLTVNEETVIKIPVGDNNNAVVLPRGTVITKTGGGNFDAADITAADIALSELSGFAIDETLLGAIQWGIPSLGLSFSQPITIYIYIGTDLSGRTLVIKRSTSADTGWTDDGIVAPGTCTVSEDGFCSFQTTKASYYSVLDSSDTTTDDTADTTEKAKITSWKVYLYDKQGTSCVQRLKLEIEGKHFDKKAEVRIGGQEASSVNRKSSKEITAKFCLEKLLDVKTNLKRTISVTNPDADTEKADKEIDLGDLSPQFSADDLNMQTTEGIKNIQSALVKLGFLDQQYITGFYGPITTEAVKKFQGANGIEQTGTVGPLTKAKLAEMTQ